MLTSLDSKPLQRGTSQKSWTCCEKHCGFLDFQEHWKGLSANLSQQKTFHPKTDVLSNAIESFPFSFGNMRLSSTILAAVHTAMTKFPSSNLGKPSLRQSNDFSDQTILMDEAKVG